LNDCPPSPNDLNEIFWLGLFARICSITESVPSNRKEFDAMAGQEIKAVTKAALSKVESDFYSLKRRERAYLVRADFPLQFARIWLLIHNPKRRIWN
jgi:hypothetical protein